MTTFLTDQLEYESANEELVVQGQISPDLADEMNKEWESVSRCKCFLYTHSSRVLVTTFFRYLFKSPFPIFVRINS